MVLYERGVRAVSASHECRVIHLVQEQSAPYACSLIGLSPAAHDLAERKLARALQIWSACQKTGKFPAYPLQICYAEPNPWQLAEAEEAEIQGHAADPAVLWGKP
jgi:hypothetical protein